MFGWVTLGLRSESAVPRSHGAMRAREDAEAVRRWGRFIRLVRVLTWEGAGSSYLPTC
jgi:hypothetical protein